MVKEQSMISLPYRWRCPRSGMMFGEKPGNDIPPGRKREHDASLCGYGMEKHLWEDAGVSRFVEERLVNGKFKQNIVTRRGRILVKL
ncbi:MAG: hypothetical protein GX989_05400 [Firmicutes bacterium]|nr:hypothetical protein [Bacillota bacterium]